MFRDFLTILVVLAVLGHSIPMRENVCMTDRSYDCLTTTYMAFKDLVEQRDIYKYCFSLSTCTFEEKNCFDIVDKESIDKVDAVCNSLLNLQTTGPFVPLDICDSEQSRYCSETIIMGKKAADKNKLSFLFCRTIQDCTDYQLTCSGLTEEDLFTLIGNCPNRQPSTQIPSTLPVSQTSFDPLPL
ncbi:unnamed protein product [Caenorhabditis brenneri]